MLLLLILLAFFLFRLDVDGFRPVFARQWGDFRDQVGRAVVGDRKVRLILPPLLAAVPGRGRHLLSVVLGHQGFSFVLVLWDRSLESGVKIWEALVLLARLFSFCGFIDLSLTQWSPGNTWRILLLQSLNRLDFLLDVHGLKLLVLELLEDVVTFLHALPSFKPATTAWWS